jgi:hypothetical protein
MTSSGELGESKQLCKLTVKIVSWEIFLDEASSFCLEVVRFDDRAWDQREVKRERERERDQERERGQEREVKRERERGRERERERERERQRD